MRCCVCLLTRRLLKDSRVTISSSGNFFGSHRSPLPDPDDPANLIKEDGVSVCSQMWIENFKEPDRIATKLSSYLRRFELWVLAYQKACINETSSYVHKSSIQRTELEDLLALRNAVLDNRFRWGSRLEFFIKSPRDKTDYQSLSKRKIIP